MNYYVDYGIREETCQDIQIVGDATEQAKPPFTQSSTNEILGFPLSQRAFGAYTVEVAAQPLNKGICLAIQFSPGTKIRLPDTLIEICTYFQTSTANNSALPLCKRIAPASTET